VGDHVDDQYAVLGVARSIGPDGLRTAWLALVRENHPDRAAPGDREAAADRTARLNAAYAVLSDPDRRARHDGRLAVVGLPGSPAHRLPAYVGSVHRGPGGLGRLGAALSVAVVLVLLGGLLDIPLLVGVGAVLLPGTGVWFLLAELEVTDRA